MAEAGLPDSTKELPCLVYHKEREPGQVFFDIEHRRWGEKNIPWLHSTMCLDANSGWLLQFRFDIKQLCILRQCTGKILPLPILPDCSYDAEVLDAFVCRLCCSPPDWHVIAIHKIKKVYYLYRPGQTKWAKYEFSAPKPPDPNAIQMVLGGAACGSKVYVMVAKYLVVISNVHRTPKARCNGTWGPWGVSDMSPPTPESCNFLHFVLQSDGNLYEVMVHLFDNKYESRPRAVSVMRLNQAARRQWEIVTSIGNKVFLLGEYYSLSLPAAADVQGDMVYFGHRGNMYAFNVCSRSLTAYFHCQHQIAEVIPSSWLLLKENQYEKAGSDHDMEINSIKMSQLSIDDAQEFDHPINISTYQPARNLLAKKGGVITWCPKTPWLLFRHGHDSTLKFLDPCSSSVYALDIPELLNKPLHHSRNGWVFASNFDRSWFFFNPFTKQKIEVPVKMSPYSHTLAISSAPCSQDCLVFTISNYSETKGLINLFSFANNALTPLSYTSSLPFYMSSSSPVYHKGLFYCLGKNGNLGVYDPTQNSWTVKQRPGVASYASLVSACFLIESEAKLFSVFMDEFDNPIGVYCLDPDKEKWIEVKDLKEKAIFVGKEASFMVPAEMRMANKIYLPVFKGKNSELRSHTIGAKDSFDGKPFSTREYLSLWIEPEGVTFELDQATGRMNQPMIRLHIKD